ncbi:unnamed protein product [Oncorhynchus mykiss]|uniref:Uncharacterized protein n=1 Tax=Oncorhynchus mykiss TaxID=8022 RepID=A0A060YQ87_ONCMY|nr:unnamed protein product [Oncorhynchus mykiss]
MNFRLFLYGPETQFIFLAEAQNKSVVIKMNTVVPEKKRTMTQHTSWLCKGYLTKKESDGVLHHMTWPLQLPDLNDECAKLSSRQRQGELGAEEGEVPGCSAIPEGEGVGGVLRAGPGAAPAPQCHLQPRQGFYHETGHQLPAHEETAEHRSVRWGE